MYIINGALGSPYSLKMRALMRYRRIAHIWQHGAVTHGHAIAKVRAPVIPVIEYPDGTFHNDSTSLIYDLERRHQERSVVPADPARAFLAHLLEDFADEWLTKAMFGYRWLGEIDQVQMSRWLAFDALKGGGLEKSQLFAEKFRERQVARMAMVGCTVENFALIEASSRAVLKALEDHVVDNHCLFGSRPSMAEFAIFGQLSQLGVDPTPQAMLRADFPYAFRWLLHIDDMSGIEGEWDVVGRPFAAVIERFLEVIGSVYLPFLVANSSAIEAGQEMFRMTAMNLPYTQGTFKYQRKCLAELRARYAELPQSAKIMLAPMLEKSNCLSTLLGPKA